MAKKTRIALKDVGEWGVIEWVKNHAPVNASGLVKGIGDDAAILIGGEIVTTDMLIEGIHFSLKWQDLAKLGRKSLAVNLSDIAAMGGFPRCAFLCIGLPKKWKWDQAETLLTGFAQAAREYGVAVAGGDTCSSPGPLIISVTLVGNTPRPALRSGARPGDAVFVTGSLGDAALALRLVTKSRGKPAVGGRNFDAVFNRLVDPKPRLRTGRAYGPYVSSMIDVSDGLISDLGHICRESNVGVKINVDKLPISEEYKFIKGRLKEREAKKLYNEAIYGGEDYELIFTVSAALRESIERIPPTSPITHIGEIVPASDGVKYFFKDKEFPINGEKIFHHF